MGILVRFKEMERFLRVDEIGWAAFFSCVKLCMRRPAAGGGFAPDRGRDEGKLRPSLRTGQADFLHPALQLVVTFKKIDMPPRVLVLRYTSPLW